jgi:eukaryotic-like serine/threonine-protein kinase
LFRFITGKPLWINILFFFVALFLLLFLFLISLDFFTKHGETLSIPQVTGMTLPEAQQALEADGFEVEIQDSIYSDTARPLSVLRQFPDADAVVKENRTVYLTVNRSVAPTIEMPNLEGMSFRTAELVMKQYGLKLEDTIYRPDFAKNSVLEQQHNDERIKPGTKIAMGSTIVLILGSGLGDEFTVPDLFGLTYLEALTVLESTRLNIGVRVVDENVTDTNNAFVYRQSPERITEDRRINRIRQGQAVDIWLGVQRPVRQIDTTAARVQNQY